MTQDKKQTLRLATPVTGERNYGKLPTADQVQAFVTGKPAASAGKAAPGTQPASVNTTGAQDGSKKT